MAVQMQQTFRNGAIRQQLPWVHIGAPLARVHRAAGAQDLREGVRDERLPGSMAHAIGRAGPLGPMGGWHMMNRSRAFRSGVSVFSWKPVTFTFMFYLSKHDDALHSSDF